jgi:hypothetical protein
VARPWSLTWEEIVSHIQTHLSKLGHRAKDKVTGLEGVITSVSFDLYGCVCVTVDPGLDKDGKHRDRAWYDIQRLEVTSSEPVMQQPDFVEGRQAEGRHGPAEKQVL